MRTSFSLMEHVLVLSNMTTTVTDGWTPDSQTKLTMSDLDATLQERCITDNIDLWHLKLDLQRTKLMYTPLIFHWLEHNIDVYNMTLIYTLLKKRCRVKTINHWRWDPMDLWVDVPYHLHIQNTRLFSCWLQRVACGNGNRVSLPESGQIGQQGTIWALHSAKFAKVCICTWVKAIFAGKLFGRTKSCHQPFVHCRVHEWRTHKGRYQNRQTVGRSVPKSKKWVDHPMGRSTQYL